MSITTWGSCSPPPSVLFSHCALWCKDKHSWSQPSAHTLLSCTSWSSPGGARVCADQNLSESFILLLCSMCPTQNKCKYKFTISQCTTESHIRYSLRLCFYKMYYFKINGFSFYNGFATMKLMVCGKSLSVPEEHTKTLDQQESISRFDWGPLLGSSFASLSGWRDVMEDLLHWTMCRKKKGLWFVLTQF